MFIMQSEIQALWRRLRALQRKLARELAEYRLGLISRDHCYRWFVAKSDHKPLPDIRSFNKRVTEAGYRILGLGAANNYLQRCRRIDDCPDPEVLLNVILPPLGKHPARAR